MTLQPGDLVDRSELDESDRLSLERALRAALRGEVCFDGATRAIYATDSSNYRQVPLGVVFPLDEDDVVRAVEVCRRFSAPILGRGAGTSLAGQACNVAVVIETSRHLNKILEIDAARRIARVQPGVVLDDLNRAARALGLTFGPDPATHAWCTLGGMVGNNSCGTHALYAGKTVENVEELTVVTYQGETMTIGPMSDDEYEKRSSLGTDAARILRELRLIREEFAEEIRDGYPDLARRVSGYNLDQLAPERGFNVARSVVGSESTCALTTEITVRLSPWPRERVLVVAGFEDIYLAADHVPELLAHGLIGLEGFDGRLVDQMRLARLNVENLPLLPEGRGWLLCELGADDEDEVRERAARLVASLPPGVNARILVDPIEQAKVWQIRESGLGATARPDGRARNFEGWEDAAVRPENLGRYLRGIRDLWAEYGYTGAWYGHFGQGCVHTRNNFDLSSVEGLRRFRSYVERAADLCVSLGGSISGEHGDGQARGELLTRMYSPRLIEAFRRFKAAWDPSGMMNPGKLIDAFPLDTNLHYGPQHRRSALRPKAISLVHDEGSLQAAVERCVGVGKCRSAEGGTMCPSYRATHDERHSTRGRAKLLGELFQGETTPETWRSRDVAEALDLCLSCKGCSFDCPTQVDMATYKSEFLYRYYEGRLRPRSAYALGLLPWTGRLGARMPRLANAVMSNRLSGALIRSLGGISQRRDAPAWASRSFRRGALAREHARAPEPSVVLWPDTFSDLYLPDRAAATLRVLERVGERVATPLAWACCGRTLYDSGMLSLARKTARGVLDALDEHLANEVPIVVPEPSCLAAFRDEIPRVLSDDPRAAKLASLSRSLTEHLAAIDWPWPELPPGGSVKVHPHCHERATRSSSVDRDVLARAGFEVEILDLGCCGLAGSFGFEKEHDELSRRIAADRFLPGIKDTGATLVLDGFSCQIQAAQLAGVATTTTAELLARRLGV